MSGGKIRVGLWALFGFQLLMAWPCGVVHGADPFPTKPIRLISPQGPGSANDLVCRMLADPLSKQLGVPVVVENKVGGGGATAGDYVAKSRPDGYTLYSAAAASIIIIPVLTTTYKPEDLVLVSKVGGSPMLLTVKADSPFKTFDEMLDFAKKNPGKLTYGTAGHGSLTYFAMEILKLKTGANMTFVPTSAGTTNLAALLGGHVDMIFDSLGTQRGLIASGNIRPLTVVPKTHFLPDVPSTAEKGLPEVPASWLAYFAPKGIPEPIVQKLAQGFETVCKSPTVISQADKMGFGLDYVRPEIFSKEIPSQYKAIEDVAKKVGLAK